LTYPSERLSEQCLRLPAGSPACGWQAGKPHEQKVRLLCGRE